MIYLYKTTEMYERIIFIWRLFCRIYFVFHVAAPIWKMSMYCIFSGFRTLFIASDPLSKAVKRHLVPAPSTKHAINISTDINTKCLRSLCSYNYCRVMYRVRFIAELNLIGRWMVVYVWKAFIRMYNISKEIPTSFEIQWFEYSNKSYFFFSV